ncbi:MAG: hypothetical protein P8Y47_09150, partial [Alphaproteobacteria bacterium]
MIAVGQIAGGIVGALGATILHFFDMRRRTYPLTRDAVVYEEGFLNRDNAFIPFERTFRGTRAIAGKLRYTGYVAEKMEPDAARVPSGEVLVSSGGGQVGGLFQVVDHGGHDYEKVDETLRASRADS